MKKIIGLLGPWRDDDTCSRLIENKSLINPPWMKKLHLLRRIKIGRTSAPLLLHHLLFGFFFLHTYYIPTIWCVLSWPFQVDVQLSFTAVTLIIFEPFFVCLIGRWEKRSTFSFKSKEQSSFWGDRIGI